MSYDLDLGRLCQAMHHMRTLPLKRFREERREMVRQSIGAHWSDESTREKIYVNLVSMFKRIVGSKLVNKEPRVMLSVASGALRGVVEVEEAWANKRMKDIHLGQTLQRIVHDALYSVGISWTALATPFDAEQVGWNLKAGEVSTRRVDLDDFVYDGMMTDFNEAGYAGFRFAVPYEMARNSPLFPSKLRKKLTPTNYSPYNLEGGDQRVSSLGRGRYAGGVDDFQDYVYLWQVYIPRMRKVLTLADDQLTGASPVGDMGDEPLREQAWVGPDEGPLEYLGYDYIPANAMPKGPIQDLIDTHELYNNIHRKVARQAERLKDLTFVAGGATEDGNRVLTANDGDMPRVDNPERIRPYTASVPNQVLIGLLMHFKDLFSWQAGNLDMLGGLSPQSKTLGQDEMLAHGASAAISDLQLTTVIFVANVVERMLWYWHHDPFNDMRVQMALKGAPTQPFTATATVQDRKRVRFEDMDIRIDPYSLVHQTPQQRLQILNQTLQQLQPYMPMAQAQGTTLDVHKYVARVAKLSDDPDLMEILTVREPPATMGGGQPQADQGAAMPAETKRTYERRSVGGASRYGKDVGVLNSMRGGESGNGDGTPRQMAA